jgi:hypothetical protein
MPEPETQVMRHRLSGLRRRLPWRRRKGQHDIPDGTAQGGGTGGGAGGAGGDGGD